MHVVHRCAGAAALGIALVVPVIITSQSGSGTPPPASSEWGTVGGAANNARHSPLNQITIENVSKLGAAWASQKFEPGVSSRAMPVVKDGLIFFTAPPSIYAVNAKTGAVTWRFQTGGGRGQGAGPGGLGSPAREGVAVAEGLVFAGLSDARVIALNEKTGELVWNQYVGDNPRDKGQVASGAPLYADGLVSIGLSADNGWRGQVVALDPKTGREAWRFFAIPGPGDPHHNTWPQNNEGWKRGGGAVWLVGAADPELGTVYYVTGNGVPQLGGEGRAGDNLYLCSIVALDAKTGKLRWHYQVIHHDIWEGDISVAPVLYDAQVDGRPHKAIAAMRADGYLFMLDRENGKPLTKVEERRVPQDAFQKTAATQPFPVGADRVLGDCDDWRKRATPKGFEIGCFFQAASVQKPNVLAPNYGMRVAPMSFSPETGYFYATGAAGLSWLRRVDDPHFFSTTFNTRVPGINAVGFGVLAAIDSRTNKIVWTKEFQTGRPSGATTTSGGLMFQAAADGNLEAYDAKSGKLLWQFQTGSAGGPVSTYQADGEQYVATISGTTVWGFKLGGTLPPASPINRPPQEPFAGPVTETNQIETAALQRDAGFTGTHYFTDEYAFAPYRARVKAGTVVTWRNNGRMVHTIVAEDGSWTTGPLNSADVGGAKFDKPGTYTYICKEHRGRTGRSSLNNSSRVGRVERPLPGMTMSRKTVLTFSVFIALLVSNSTPHGGAVAAQGAAAAKEAPIFEVDARWPKALPNNWTFGEFSGVAVDAHDHVWINQRPKTLADDEKYLTANPPVGDCCAPGPPIMEFDADGNFVNGWGGPGAGYEWPENEHGIHVDHRDNVWVGGNGMNDAHILKFTKTGKFLLQIGHLGKSAGSNDTENLRRPSKMQVSPKTNELFVSDGYGNRRVIVFDAETGQYKRHWGAYGNKPDDQASRDRIAEGPGPQQFNLVHGLRLSKDDLVYVGDRINNRIQAFRTDGTFVKEAFIARKSLGNGVAYDVDLSADPAQRFLYVPDGTNNHVWILNRSTLEIVGQFGRQGRYAGQFHHVHSIAVDSKGNIYTAETQGKRVQKFVFKGLATRPGR